MRRSKIEIARPRIVSYFNRKRTKIFKYNKLSSIFSARRKIWNLPVSLSFRQFVDFLLENTDLKFVDLDFPHRRYPVFTWGEASVYQVVGALEKSAYLTHYSAMFLHNLTKQIPRNIYLNLEQRPKSFKDASLEQDRIDRAFSNKPRITSNIAVLGDYRIFMVNGMHTKQMGVESTETERGIPARVTGLERTLIDITVRPFYSGGIFEVLEAFRRARGAFKPSALAGMLKKLSYIYPYHQAVGFYMERAGYPKKDLKQFKDMKQRFDFYLTHRMKKKEYSEKWRLFFPKGL